MIILQEKNGEWHISTNESSAFSSTNGCSFSDHSTVKSSSSSCTSASEECLSSIFSCGCSSSSYDESYE